MTTQTNPTTPDVEEAQRHDAESAARKEVAVDHRFLNTAMSWLENAREEAAIASMLDDLNDYLQGHFKAEEKEDGFFEQVLNHAPHRQSYIEQLKREHGEVTEELEALRGTIEAPFDNASDELVEGVERLVGTLRKHERREASLLQDVHDRDFGGG